MREMNKTGKLVLINGTQHDFKKVHTYSYQLVSFRFPEVVRSATCELCEIQWSRQSLTTSWSDSADVTYQLEGTDYRFQLHARTHFGTDLYVSYTDLSNLGSHFIRLEWLDVANGYMQFFLCGRENKFVSTGSTSGANCWMFENLDILGDRTLRELCLPASHDSGMSEINWRSVFSTSSNTQTQLLNIYDQLQCGVRFFDIRPVISHGQFYTGHYANVVGVTYQGALGQSIRLIIDQINSFCAVNSELIILSLSHPLNLDLGLFDRPLSQDEFDRLCYELLNINHRFIAPADTVDLLDKPLNWFIGRGRPAVCIVVNDVHLKINPLFCSNKGFYSKKEFNVIDLYANTNRLEVMIADQMNKLRAYRSKNARNYFLLSWTLTQQNVQTALGQSIASMAITANSYLFKLLACEPANEAEAYSFKRFVKKAYPNVISLDFVNTDVTALSLGINLFNATISQPVLFSHLKRLSPFRRKGVRKIVRLIVRLLERLIERYLLLFAVFLLFNLAFYVHSLVTF